MVCQRVILLSYCSVRVRGCRPVQEVATQACLQAEEGIVERDQKILALTNELELVREVLTKLSGDLADAKAEVLQLQV
jgi:hypothetical protein